MKAHLMYKDRDFDLKRRPARAAQHRALTQDLELNTLFECDGCRRRFFARGVEDCGLD